MFKKIIFLLSVLVLLVACDNSSDDSVSGRFEGNLSGGGLLIGTYNWLIEFDDNQIVTAGSSVHYLGELRGSFTSGAIDESGAFTAAMIIDDKVTDLTGTYNSGTDELSGTLVRDGTPGTFEGAKKSDDGEE